MIGGAPPRTFILSSSVAAVLTKIANPVICIANPVICIAIAVANVCKVNQIRASTNP